MNSIETQKERYQRIAQTTSGNATGIDMLTEDQQGDWNDKTEEGLSATGLPQYITLKSEREKYGIPLPEWTPENTTIRATDHTPEDYCAMKADIGESEPSIETMKLRAVYRSRYDFHLRKESERFIVVTTYGPDPEKFDIEDEEVGFEVWGFASSIKEAGERIMYIRKTNPHAIMYPMRLLSNLGKIPLPLPDTGVETVEANKQHQKRVKERHVGKTSEECGYIESRVTHNADSIEQKKQALRRLELVNEYLSLGAKAAPPALKKEVTGIMLEDKKEIPIVFDDYTPDPLAVSPGNLPLLSNLESLPSVNPDMVSSYARVVESDGTVLPPGAIRDFVTTKMPDGRTLLISRTRMTKKSLLPPVK